MKDIGLDRLFLPPEPSGPLVDLSWCVRLSFESLHTQQVLLGNNTGLYFASVSCRTYTFTHGKVCFH